MLKAIIGDAAALWGLPELLGYVEIRFSRRLRRSFGRAVPATGRISLHQALAGEHAELLPEVLIHELAHVAVHLRHGPGRRPHGKEWAALVRMAGYPPRVRMPVALPVKAPLPTRRRSVLGALLRRLTA